MTIEKDYSFVGPINLGGGEIRFEESAALVDREFSLPARISRARRNHKRRSHLLRHQRLAKAAELVAA